MSALKHRRHRKRWEGGYGFFPGGDPRRFSPDEDGALPEELEAHKAACAAAEAGDVQQAGSCIHAPGMILTMGRFGLGTYAFPVRDRGNPRQRELVRLAAGMAFDAEVLGLRQPKVKRGQRR